jgi:hypothetical protein
MRIALLGAGFTRNWGGWLASELVGELCGRVDGDTELLRRLKEIRNFEQVLGELRQEANRGPVQQHRFELLQRAVLATFDEMNQMLAAQRFEFNMSEEWWVSRFLADFDAIFTLNQDLLLELHYLPGKDIERERKWRTTAYPGIALPPNWSNALPLERLQYVLSEAGPIEHDSRDQPIYKLHGSANWRTADGSPIVVIGGGKEATIRGSTLLSEYLGTFRKYLSAGETKLMVIGYSFADDHVNDVLTEASQYKGVKTYLINPAGLSVFDAPPNALVTQPKKVFSALNLSGILTRSFRDAFWSDRLAFNSIQRFLHGNQQQKT